MKPRLPATALVAASACALALGACTPATAQPRPAPPRRARDAVAVVPTNPWFVRMRPATRSVTPAPRERPEGPR